MTGKRLLLDRTKLHVFAYGSNMSVPKMRDWVATAVVAGTGYIPGRRLVFNKRSVDGSAKVNAEFTGNDADRVWGVIYRIAHRDKVVLDRLESEGRGYEREEVEAVVADLTVPVSMYVARSEMIDPTLRPYSWYHQLILHAALHHGLPDAYINALAGVEAIADPDRVRDRRHREMIDQK